MKKLTHVGDDNRPTMVDVGDKPESHRSAQARGKINLNEETVKLISENAMKKGNVLITAELAGVQAAKQTSNLIPLCHTLLLSKVHVKCTLCEDGVVALLTIYDMCEAVDKKMTISEITLLNKTKELTGN